MEDEIKIYSERHFSKGKHEGHTIVLRGGVRRFGNEV